MWQSLRLISILSVRSDPKKLTNKNNKILVNSIIIITKQINQTEKHEILRGSIKLIYVHGQKSSTFTIIERKYKKREYKILWNISYAQKVPKTEKTKEHK